ncbi:hypothetical protein GF340_03050 [Candidatus Peregrinibacteria bacterium]|nr:hypothetical protein [Candidatus Peregrinibacteria bacterium]
MFKIRVIASYSLIIAAVVFSLGACQNNNDDRAIIDDRPTDRRIGEIKSLGSTVSTKGTHLLELDDGSTILLRSLSINLDNTDYKNKLVEVRGYINYSKELAKPLMDVDNIDIIDVALEDDEEEPKWQKFEDATIDLSIKYRDDFEQSIVNGDIIFEKEIENVDETANGEADDTSLETSPQAITITVSTISKSDDLDLLSYLNLESDDSSTLLGEGFTKSKIGLKNMDALKFVNENNGSLEYYVENEDLIFIFSFKANSPDYREYENLFYEMLRSVEIGASDSNIDDDSDNEQEETTENEMREPTQIDIESYETFESDSVGFEIAYPANYYFEGQNSDESGVSQVYTFADGPLEENDPLITVEIKSGDSPASNPTKINGETVYVSESGNEITAVRVIDGRLFEVSGRAGIRDTVLGMASSIQ